MDSTSDKKNGLKWWHWVLIIFGVFVLVGIIAGGDSSSNQDTGNSVSTSGSNKEVVTSDNPVATGNSVKTSKKIEILDSKITYGDYGNLIVLGSAKNIAGRELSYAEVDVKFYDNSGAVIGTSLDNINNLGDGEIWKFNVYYFGMDDYNVDHYSIQVGSVW